jgi:beta-N-acetylhexosaminidase
MKLFFTCLLSIGVISTSYSQIDSLSIKIGQMLLIGFADTKVDEKVLKEIRDGKVGSIIIFEKNIPKSNSYMALKKIIWTYQQAAATPLFIAIDQEGGRVNRLKEKYGFPRSVSAAYAGKSKSLDTVRFYAQATAATLAGLGINVNFAPTVDLASNPDNPIIAKVERSYSADADTVNLMAKAFIEEHRKLGVITVLKHFPGHGSSKADTHLGIADVTNTWHENELVPYKKLLQAGYVDGVMSAHIVNKKLDARGLPGTLSDSILGNILRKEIGYTGVVFSDDMQMHAITKHYGLEEAIKLAILAGVDVMTFSNNISGSEERTVDKVHGIIKKLVQNGTINEERINESYQRIITLKKSFAYDKAYYQREVLSQKHYALQNLRRAEKQLKQAQENYNKINKTTISETAPEKEKKKKRSKKKQ